MEPTFLSPQVYNNEWQLNMHKLYYLNNLPWLIHDNIPFVIYVFFLVSLLEGDLAEVEAMRDVKIELIAKKEVM